MESNVFENQLLNAEAKLSQIVDFIKKEANNHEAHQMEEQLFEQLQKLGVVLMEEYFKTIEDNDVGDCLIDKNGVELVRHGKKSKNYISIFGVVKPNRTIYWSKGQDVVVPLDKQCNLPKSQYSYLVQDMINSLSVNTPFQESKEYFKKFFNQTIHVRQIEEMSDFANDEYENYYATKEVPDTSSEGEFQVLSFDGKGVPLIKKEAAKIIGKLGKGEKRQKKKEALVGVSYTVDENYRSAEEIAGNLVYPEDKDQNNAIEKNRAQNIRRMASVEQPKTEVIEQILQDSLRRNQTQSRSNIVLIDGMPSLQKQIEKQIDNRIDYCIILDIIHVTEYIWIAGNTLFGEKTEEGEKFVFKQLTKILKGEVGRVIGALKQIITKGEKTGKLGKSKLDALKKVVRYLSNHRKIMKYDEYLRNGYPIGTGVVESACKQVVKQRMEGSGMRWSIKGAENILLLRSIKTSGDWNDFNKFNVEKLKIKLYPVYQTIRRAS